MELRLPSMVRCEIVRRIDSADLAIFNRAQEKVFDILLKEVGSNTCHTMAYSKTRASYLVEPPHVAPSYLNVSPGDAALHDLQANVDVRGARQGVE
eukprot:16706-Eustigmatos_ZCMA.PRE.1